MFDSQTLLMGMYGKHFSSMYSGSMVGAGALVFAVMGYVISNYQLDWDVGAQVEINPKLLAVILGESQKDVEKAIEFLCAPDPESRSKEESGRRLVKVGQFDYRVVNGAKYNAIRDQEARREYNRMKKRQERLKKGKGAGSRERAYVREFEDKGPEAADSMLREEVTPYASPVVPS